MCERNKMNQTGKLRSTDGTPCSTETIPNINFLLKTYDHFVYVTNDEN